MRIFGNALLLVFVVLVTFDPAAKVMAMTFAKTGRILLMAWSRLPISSFNWEYAVSLMAMAVANPAWCLTGLLAEGKQRDFWRLVTGKGCSGLMPPGN